MSIVEARWRAFTAAARWNGHPAYSTTGTVSTSCSHGSSGTPGTIESTSTASVRGAATSSRRRRLWAYDASVVASSGSSAEGSVAV